MKQIFLITFLVSSLIFIAKAQENKIDILIPEYITGNDDYPVDFAKGYYTVEKTDREGVFKRDSVMIEKKIREGDTIGAIKNIDQISFMVKGLTLPEFMTGTDLELQMLFPGEMCEVRLDSNIVYVLYALGTIVENQDTLELSPFASIKDYQFRVRRMVEGKIVDQLIYKMDIHKWVNNSYLNQLILVWAGDLDNDQLLDLVYITQNHHECFEVRLLKTMQEDSEKAFKEVAVNEECW